MSEKSIRDFIHKGESIIMEKKHVVIGVSGGIAAYKACDLVSKLSKKDYDKKLDIIQLYSSQSKVMDHLHHMLPYENWKPYSNWGKIE